MSIEATSWALNVPVGGNTKVVLLGLANHAHPDGTEAYPALDTLAKYAHCHRNTARRNVRELVEGGWVVEDGYGPRGQTKYRLAMERGTDSVPAPDREGTTSASEAVPPAVPEPSIEPSRGEKSTRDPRESVPDGFPDHLRPHAREVFRILRAVAEQHGCKRVWPLEVGRVIMARPRHPLVATAHEMASWAVDPPREIKDAVATYRTFLKRERELEATENLAPDGTPANGNGKAPAGVTHLRPNASAEERRMERQRQRAARIAEYDRADSQSSHNGAMILAYPTTEEA